MPEFTHVDKNLPAWAKVGVVGIISFLLLFLLGAIPGMFSPIDRITNALDAHDRKTSENTELLRQVCRNTARLAQEWRCERIPVGAP